MTWKQMVRELNLNNEEKFFELLKRTPCEPMVYILKVKEVVEVEPYDYYKILMKKYEEEKYEKLFKIAREFEYLLRDDREREKTW